MPFEREDIIKINGITLYAKNDDWGQSGKQSGNKVLLTDETSSQQTDCQLDTVDFRIEAYYLGKDYKNVVAKLYRIYRQQKTMLLEHHDIGRVKVKFARNGYRVKKSNNRLWYREFTLNLIKANAAGLKIDVVEVEQLDETQLEQEAELTLDDILALFDLSFLIDDITSLVKNDVVNNLFKIGGAISNLSADNLLNSLTNPFTSTFDNLVSMSGGIGGTLLSYLNLGKSKKDRSNAWAASQTDSSNAKKYFQSYIDIAEKIDDSIDLSDSQPEVRQNTTAALDLVKQAAIVKACECVTDKPFDTKEEIETAIKELEEISDQIIQAAEKDKTIQNDLHNVVNQAIVILQSQPVCNARQIQTNICLPAVVICHAENCSEAAFLKNNNIRHPLFVPAGVKLEVAEND